MSRQINQPINQVKLTNVAVVRLTAAGRRFEIACYRNKVLDYRAGLETDLSEVLQSDRIFTNVSKGRFAAAADCAAAFGTADQEAIAVQILKRGKSLQVGDLERADAAANCTAQIAVWVAANTVNGETGTPFTVSAVTAALQQTGFAVHPHKPIKPQCLAAVKFLKDAGRSALPNLERAPMELSLQYEREAVPASSSSPDDNNDDVVDEALQHIPHKLVTDTRNSSTRTVVVRVDPSRYRELNELSKQVVAGRLQILQQVVVTGTAAGTAATASSSGGGGVGGGAAAAAPAVEERRGSSQGKQQQQQQQLRGQQQQQQHKPHQEGNEKKKHAVEDHHDDDDDKADNTDNDDDNQEEEEEEEDLIVFPTSRKNRRKEKKKNQKQQRRQQRHQQEQQEQQEQDPQDQQEQQQHDYSTKSSEKKRKNTKKKKKQTMQGKQQQEQQEPQGEQGGEEEGTAGGDAPGGGGGNGSASAASAATGAAATAGAGAGAAAAAAAAGAATATCSIVNAAPTTATTTAAAVAVRSCNTCGGAFPTDAEYRHHFRSDWHRFNLQLKMKNIPAVTFTEFETVDRDALLLQQQEDGLW